MLASRIFFFALQKPNDLLSKLLSLVISPCNLSRDLHPKLVASSRRNIAFSSPFFFSSECEPLARLDVECLQIANNEPIKNQMSDQRHLDSYCVSMAVNRVVTLAFFLLASSAGLIYLRTNFVRKCSKLECPF